MRDLKESGNADRSRLKWAEDCDLGALPENLVRQCRDVIESYHASHGYFCLPDMLWKSRLGPLIERDPTLRKIASNGIYREKRKES